MQSLIFERTYQAPLERVWQAITGKDLLKEWYFEVLDFKPEVGFTFHFYGENNGIKFLHQCVVTEVSPQVKLSYTWRYEGYHGQSLLTFELFAESRDTTRLKLTHSGTETFPLDHPDFAGADFSEGWNMLLGTSLLNFVEKDTIAKTIQIKAAAASIWDTILHPNGQWGKAFGDGALAATDWLEGSPVIWTDADHNIAASGVIAAHRPGSFLRLHYYDEIDHAPGTPLGDYSEKFELTPGADHAVLRIEAGLISKKDIDLHSGMWDEALRIIQETAEKARS